MKKISIAFIGIFMILGGISLLVPDTRAASMADTLSGKILLQVQSKGEAWYVHPVTKVRHYMGRPNDAFVLMRSQGLGISNGDIEKIPIGIQAFSGSDADGDGLSDLFEDAVGTNKNMSDTDGDAFSDQEEVSSGYNPLGIGVVVRDQALVGRLKGRIVLQTQRHGEAWYVSPIDGKRYFLGRPADAFEVMRRLGLGITNQDLQLISEAASIGAPQQERVHESGTQSGQEPEEGSSGQSNTCVVTGCSGQLCADTEVTTTCEFKEEYACYQLTQCERQANGQCGWTHTEELTQCIADAQQMSDY